MSISSSPAGSPSRRRFALKWMLGVAALGLVAGLILTRHRPSRKIVPWRSVARTNLVLHGGHWYLRPGTTNPFTGWMVENYPDGSRRSRLAVSNGLLNGVCEGWYTNGQLRIREHFKNSVSDGPREKWYANGRRKSQANIVNGKMEGVFRRWYDNGQLAERIEMQHGQPSGLAWAYYRSGFAKAETHVRRGRVLDRKIWKDGKHRISE